MIAFHASTVCHVRDGYTGRPLEASMLLCTLDGAQVRPLGKPGGYLILLDLSHGMHRLVLRGAGYQEEWVDFHADAGTRELEITMKPGAGYPFRENITRLELMLTAGGVPAAGRQIWLASPGGCELKIAQTRAEAGASQFRAYCRGAESAVARGAYLIADGADSEIVVLQEMENEMCRLAAPLIRAHGRSRQLLPAQRYHASANGRISAVFREACTLELYSETEGLLASLPLEAGENRQTIGL